jgi:elongation factor 1 alpha-like protein
MLKGVKQMPVSRRTEIEKKIQSRSKGKEHLNMVVIGHVDAGKSTIMGHLLYKLGVVNQKTMHK